VPYKFTYLLTYILAWSTEPSATVTDATGWLIAVVVILVLVVVAVIVSDVKRGQNLKAEAIGTRQRLRPISGG